jgi:predicted lipoprotein with Yx(FWY)xxD motif
MLPTMLPTACHLIVASTLVGIAGCASPGSSPAFAANGALVDARGMTLYTFEHDGLLASSMCNGACAVLWPPLVATDAGRPQGEWRIVQRDDGRRQWTYKGRPLYTFAQDRRPGEHGGEGFRNVWHVARP